jgi:hypothetical protein
MHDDLQEAYAKAKAAGAGSTEDASYKRQLAMVAGRYDAMSGASPDNAEVLATQVMAKNMDGKTIHQHIEDARTDENFQTMRKEFEKVAGGHNLTAEQRAAADAQAAGNTGALPPPGAGPLPGPFG